jgi:hypothetical protein
MLYSLNAATLAGWAILSLLVVGLARRKSLARLTQARSNWESWTADEHHLGERPGSKSGVLAGLT